MRVEWLMLCQSFEERANGSHDIIGALSDTIVVHELPFQVQFLGRVACQPDTSFHEARFELFGPDMASLHAIEGRFNLPNPPSDLPAGWEVHRFLPFGAQLPDVPEGIYTAALTVDGANETTQFQIKRDLRGNPSGRPTTPSGKQTMNREQRRHQGR